MRLPRNIYSIFLIVLVLQINWSWAALSDKRLCADPKCQDIISIAKAKLTYTAAEKGMVSFKINSSIRVKSKSAGSNPELWGIEVNGRQGYAPKEFIKEEKIRVKEKDLTYVVPVELPDAVLAKTVDTPAVPLSPSEASIKEKADILEVTTTLPLVSEVGTPDATPNFINSTENELEVTTMPLTAPLGTEEEKIINQPLRETATPVVGKVEVIDGTLIPVADEMSNVDIEQTKKSQAVNIQENEPATPKLETTTTEATTHTTNIDKVLEMNELKIDKNTKPRFESEETIEPKDNEATISSINKQTEDLQQQEASQSEEVDEVKEVFPETGEKDKNVAESADGKEKIQITEELLKHETTTLKADEVATQVTNMDKTNEENKSKNNENVDPKKESEEMVGPKANEALISSLDKQTEDLQQQVAGQSVEVHEIKEIFANSGKINRNVDELPNEKENIQIIKENNITTELKSDIPVVVDSKSQGIKENLENKDKIENSQEYIKLQEQEGRVNIEEGNGYFADKYQDDEEIDDDEDEEDIDEEDIEEEEDNSDEENPQSSSVELKMPEDSETVTDSGYITRPNPNYWEEDIPATTPAPHIAEELPKLNISEEKTDERNSEEKTDERNSEEVASIVGSQESSTPIALVTEESEIVTSMPNVPTLPTTLPLFKQPNVIKQQREHVQEQVNPYDNPNDYYRKQALTKQKENSNDLTSDTSTAQPVETSSERYVSTSEEEFVFVDDFATKQDPNEDYVLGTGNFNGEQISELKNQHSHEDISGEKHEHLDYGTGSIATETNPSSLPEKPVEVHKQLPKDEKRDAGLFNTILGTVNTFVNKLRKEPQSGSQINEDDALQRILYPDRYTDNKNMQQGEQYCEKLSPHHCPQKQMASSPSSSFESQHCHYDWSNLNMDNFVDVFVSKVFEMRELLSCLAIAASTILLFLFGYYCFCNSSREGALISKLNLLERSLLASHKENAILKDDLFKTRNKLTSIEDNSFGSNDMVISLKKELEVMSEEKSQLQDHVHSLEKELETAAEAGLELNKIVAELLNNQTGQESMIMNSVEDLQMQFNEQQKTIFEINANLAEKSRDNSELQLMLAEQEVRLNGELASLQQDNDELEAEKAALQTRLEDAKIEFEEDITKALEGKNVEIKRLQNDIIEIKNRYEDIHTKWQTSLAKIEALEECMKTIKRDPSVNISDVINVANVRAELLDLQHQRTSLKSRLDVEMDARQHAENGLQNAIGEVDKLKQDFHQSEKDKLEAQTRLEVLSNYFKEKETQLQKELSLKEAVWLKQQGENTSTVDRLTAMQEEIQSLKSQNDALRAEIEAQLAAHKAQTGTLENRAHETWLAARQSERRYEEARAEAAALRRRLTELAGAANAGDGSRVTLDSKISTGELNNAPSPILPPALLDNTAGSPLLGRLPPPLPQFMPFMGPPPPPFLNLPPPPFLSSVEMRPAPLGRMMSPQLGRYSPGPQRDRQRRRERENYYDDEYDYDDDDDYDVDDDDYEYDDDEDAPRQRRQRRRSGNGSDNWRRDNFSPPPPARSYRSHSPTDSRYNYTGDRDLMSTYDTETDLSPPPSPPERHLNSGGGSRTGSYHTYSPQSATTSPYIAKEAKTGTRKNGKGSDSEKSCNSAHHNKKGKSMV